MRSSGLTTISPKATHKRSCRGIMSDGHFSCCRENLFGSDARWKVGASDQNGGDLRVRRPGAVPGRPSAPGGIVIETPQTGWPWVGKGPAPFGYDGGRDAYHSRVCLKVTKASLRRQR